ncbi:MAG: serine hydrolase domain-containing protein [Mycobacteriales bacterium]
MPTLQQSADTFLAQSPAVPGCVVHRIDRAGKRSQVAAGWADREHTRPMTPDATFRLASSTKTFTAAVTLRLAEEGGLTVEDKIGKFLSTDLVQRLGLADISLRHLMQHTSGLTDMDGAEFMRTLAHEPTKRWTPWEKIERGLASGARTGPVGPPARYCDVGYQLLAMVIEAATSQPLHRVFRQLLRFDELGLSSIYVEQLEQPPIDGGPRVRHYIDTWDVTEIDPSCDLWGAGGLVANGRDLAEWWNALFSGEIFADERVLQSMLATVPEPSAGREMGLGIYRRYIDDQELWAHGGAWGTYPVHNRTTGITAAIMLNQSLDHAGPHLRTLALEATAD